MRLTLADRIISSSLASRFGRKPTFFALWFILAMSILCETLARNWKVWVSRPGHQAKHELAY